MMTRDISCNEVGHTTFILMLQSDSDHRAFDHSQTQHRMTAPKKACENVTMARRRGYRAQRGDPLSASNSSTSTASLQYVPTDCFAWVDGHASRETQMPSLDRRVHAELSPSYKQWSKRCSCASRPIPRWIMSDVIRKRKSVSMMDPWRQARDS